MRRKVPKRSDARQSGRRREGERPELLIRLAGEFSPDVARTLVGFEPLEPDRTYDVAAYAPDLGQLEHDTDGMVESITFDAARVNARAERALRALRDNRPEDVVLNYAVRLELTLQVLEIERRLRVQKTAKASAVRQTKPHPLSEEIERLIRTRGLSDRAIARQLEIDRGAVARERNRLGITAKQVRDIRDGIA